MEVKSTFEHRQINAFVRKYFLQADLTVLSVYTC